MKRKVSKFKKHNFCTTDKSEAVTNCSTKKSALKNFAIPTRKHPRRSLSTINSQVLGSAALSKTDAKTLTFTFYPRCFISVCFTNSMGPVDCNLWYFTAV